MDGWVMVAVYVAGAGALALIANHSRVLRGAVGWGKFGAKNRPSDVQGAQAAVLAAWGTDRDATNMGKWRVYRPSIGVRLLPIALGAAMICHYLFPEQIPGMQLIPTQPEMMAAMLLAVAASCAYVWRARISTNGEVLRVRGLIRDQRFNLANLVSVEEDAVHSYRLAFTGGRHVEILKTVEGAAELRHMLETQLDQNQRG